MHVTVNGVNDGAEYDHVMLPGSLMAPSVSSANDSDLTGCLDEDLAALASIIEPTKPTKEGMAPAEWHAQAKANRVQHHNLAAVERIERRIVAIRSELEQRKAQAKEEAQAEKERARQALENVLEKAPKQAAELAEMAEKVSPAAERLRQLAADIELVAGGSRLDGQYAQIEEGAEVAADALGKDMPRLDALPDNLPTPTEAKHLLNTISGRVEGFSRLGTVTGDAGRARDLARKLK